MNDEIQHSNQLCPTTAAHRILLTLFLLVLAISCINPPWPLDFTLQHIPTTVALVVLLILQARIGVSLLSYSLILAFALLHLLGARYLYSNVPYNDWAESLIGISFNELLGLGDRNHYDRLVHFLFGVLIAIPAWRFSRRVLKLNHIWSAVIAMMFILAMGSIYEIAEWGVAMLLSPEAAENYNGQQGDPWDPQRDMLLAAIGASISLAGVLIVSRRKT